MHTDDTHAAVSPEEPRLGYSLVEVLVALTLLSIGVLAQAGTLALVAKLVNRTRLTTHATTVALTHLERTRLAVRRFPIPCSGPVSGGPMTVGHVQASWTGYRSGAVLYLAVVTTHPSGAGAVVDTVTTVVPC